MDHWLCKSDMGLEFGSGRSTLWFSKRTKSLTSVEHNHAWFERIGKQLSERAISNVDYVLQPVEDQTPTEYSNVASRFADSSLDFVLVDGAERSACALASIAKIRPGGILILDNVNWVLPSNTKSPASIAADQVPVSPAWQLIQDRLVSWRCIWTSNGVTDTAIYVKPSLAVLRQ